MRRGRVLTVVLGLCAPLALAAAVVPVAVPAASALPARLGLVSQSPFDVAADGSIAFVLDVPDQVGLATVPDATLVVTAYRPVVNRAEVDAARKGELRRVPA